MSRQREARPAPEPSRFVAGEIHQIALELVEYAAWKQAPNGRDWLYWQTQYYPQDRARELALQLWEFGEDYLDGAQEIEGEKIDDWARVNAAVSKWRVGASMRAPGRLG